MKPDEIDTLALFAQRALAFYDRGTDEELQCLRRIIRATAAAGKTDGMLAILCPKAANEPTR